MACSNGLRHQETVDSTTVLLKVNITLEESRGDVKVPLSPSVDISYDRLLPYFSDYDNLGEHTATEQQQQQTTCTDDDQSQQTYCINLATVPDDRANKFQLKEAQYINRKLMNLVEELLKAINIKHQVVDKDSISCTAEWNIEPYGSFLITCTRTMVCRLRALLGMTFHQDPVSVGCGLNLNMDAAIEQYAPTETHNDTPTVSLSLPYGVHPSCLHMQVRSGSKTKNLVQFVIRKLISSDQNSTNIEQVTWNAFDDGYKRIEQIWQPVNVDVELDTLKLWKLYRRQHPLTTGAVFISWFFSILFVFLLPLDNSSAAYRECIQNNSASTSTITPDSLNRSNSKEVLCPRPWSHVDQRSYGILWRIIYWTPQFLIWICFTTYAVNLSNR
ncbi:unnamed protein product [Rotaria magnacalcarata]|uniref:Uncharacterized protein n=4 Tax=Rotaria magnacalcarata TaxID=392030 RepID=A0A8S2LKF6_9BILA|nr:unnamed protein product [Rotaria magnacalcarata]